MPEADYSIRVANPADAEVIAECNAMMAEETEQRRLDRPTLLAGVRAVLEDPGNGLYYLAELDGGVVGQLMITYEWSDWRNGLFWWIQSVYVVPQMRRKGVYRALHRHVEAAAHRTPGVCGIRLYVDTENEAAQDTYHQLGMVQTGYLLFEADWSAARPNDG